MDDPSSPEPGPVQATNDDEQDVNPPTGTKGGLRDRPLAEAPLKANEDPDQDGQTPDTNKAGTRTKKVE